MLNTPPRSTWAQGVRATSRCRHRENVTAARVELRVPASQAGNPGAVGIDTNQKITQNRCPRTKAHVKEDVELTEMIGQLRQSPSDGGDMTRRPARPRRTVALLSIDLVRLILEDAVGLATDRVANKAADVGPWLQLALLLLGFERPRPAPQTAESRDVGASTR